MSLPTHIDGTHNPDMQSWVVSANAADTDFPIQNLPYGRFRVDQASPWRIGVAIGDQILDLRAAGLIDFDAINQLLALDKNSRLALRTTLSNGLQLGSVEQAHWAQHLVAQTAVQLGVPADIRDYTDFYIGIHHATCTGKLFRPDNPLLPNYKHVPIGYHGRASTVVASGTTFKRPMGQTKAVGQDTPSFGPCQRLDFELEIGVVIGGSNPQGESVSMNQAEDHIFGLTLFNDWSARDIQVWESQPLGPFLAKSFASTISPWLVTLEALAPFRDAYVRPSGDPALLPYLDSTENQRTGAIDVDLEVWLQTEKMRQAGMAPEIITRSNFSQAAYWTIAQLVAHHTSNGCSLSVGDLFGTGTLSGPLPEQGGALMELSQGGKLALTLSNGESRIFLEDGDTVILRGACNRPGYRKIGFGECRGTVTAAN